MNNVILMGRLTRDPEIKTTATGKMAKFTLAVDRRTKAEKAADFISCTAFDKTAELLENYTAKGTKLLVEGRIQTGSYEKDGKKVYTTDVIVNRTEFVESRKQSDEQAAAEPVKDDWMNIPDDGDEVPFN